MTSQMIVRINPEKREKLNRLSKAEGKSTSEIIRELIDDFIKERDIGSYIDDLWQRSSQTMSRKGHSLKDIQEAINESRKATRAGDR